ncbi:MAG: nucleotide exchange factor GrpE [Candidatus Lokiarchaeota archaeon]
MVFEDFYDNFFNQRKALEDPRDKITISKREYNKLREIAEKYEALAKKLDSAQTEKTALHKQLEDLKEDGRQLKELEEKTEKYLNSLVRTRADFENYKRSVVRDKEHYNTMLKEKIIKKLIDHYEDLLRAQKVLEINHSDESIKNGFQMIVKNFEKLLNEEGVEPMNCKGEKFDPYKHESVIVEENNDLPDNTILEVIDKGYYLNNNVLKPARVKVSKSTN